MRKLLVAGLIALLGTSPAFAGAVSQTVLDNGLTVLAVQSEAASMAGIGLVIGSSVADEPEDLQGGRALLQQMMTVDQQDRLAEQLRPVSAVVKGRGSAFAVNTDWDFVEISMAVAAEEFSEGLDIVANSVFEVELKQETLDRSIRLVKEAYDRHHQSPVQLTFDLFRGSFYGAHPMGRGLYGCPEQFEEIELADVQRFRDQHYVSANAWLCVVSPFDPEDAIAEVRGSFDHLSSSSPPPETMHPEVPERSTVEVGDSRDLVQASMVVGVPLPGYGDPLFHAGEIIAAVLEGPSGRLRRDLGLLQALGLSIPSRLLEQHYPISTLPVPTTQRPYLAIHALCSPRQVERVRTGLLRHLLALREGTVTETELERARKRVINSHRHATDRPTEAALYLARRAFFGMGDAEEAIANIQQVTDEDLSEVARRYFDRHAIGVQMPST